MKRSEFEVRLAQLQRPYVSPARARMLTDELLRAAPRADHDLRERAREVAERLGFPFAAAPAPLDVGESWLLLFEPPSRGHAVRLRAAHGRPGDKRLAFELRRAFRGLSAAAAAAGRRVGQTEPPGVDFDLPIGNVEIEGSSLGLSVAIASLSLATGRAPLSNVAGTAQISDDGRLGNVEHLATKLEGVRRAHPEITRVVVAKQQHVSAYSGPIEIVKARDLAEAIPLFGLAVEGLEPARIEAYLSRPASLRAESAQRHTAKEWSVLSLNAWEASRILQSHYPSEAGEALVFAALFAVHAGDPSAAVKFLSDVSDSDAARFPELEVRLMIAGATAQIDNDEHVTAIALAERAVRECAGPNIGGRDRRELLGQALGTLGRALMHSGAAAAAEDPLRQALLHHRHQCPPEAPRSACHLATCLRLLHRHAEALTVVDEALASFTGASDRLELAVTTTLYLRLERGRTLLAMNRPEAAIGEFEAVRAGQDRDAGYPQLGAVRSLASAYRMIGDRAHMDEAIAVCLAIASGPAAHGRTIARVAAIAIGEALLDGSQSFSRAELEGAWRAAFGEDASPNRIREILRSWIY